MQPWFQWFAGGTGVLTYFKVNGTTFPNSKLNLKFFLSLPWYPHAWCCSPFWQNRIYHQNVIFLSHCDWITVQTLMYWSPLRQVFSELCQFETHLYFQLYDVASHMYLYSPLLPLGIWMLNYIINYWINCTYSSIYSLVKHPKKGIRPVHKLCTGHLRLTDLLSLLETLALWIFWILRNFCSPWWTFQPSGHGPLDFIVLWTFKWNSGVLKLLKILSQLKKASHLIL